MYRFLVKWIDDKGVERQKEYETYDEASKARLWLAKHGASVADIAMIKT